MLSVWVTGGRTFQGLSPRFHVRLSEFDCDPLSLQERGCSQVGCCCLPVLKVLCVCRAREKEKRDERGGRAVGGWGSSWTSPSLASRGFYTISSQKWKCHGSVHLPNNWNLGQWFIYFISHHSCISSILLHINCCCDFVFAVFFLSLFLFPSLRIPSSLPLSPLPSLSNKYCRVPANRFALIGMNSSTARWYRTQG